MHVVIAEPATGTDAALIAGSYEQPEEFAALFDRHAAMVYRYVSRRLGPQVAEDLVGETFLVAFRRRQRYDTAYADARPWLLGIATKLISRHRRAEATRYRAIEQIRDEPLADSPVERVLEEVAALRLRPALAHALAGLSQADRDTLLLIAWADLTYEQTAAALSIPVGTVRSRLHRARRQLRAALGGTDPTEESNDG